MQPALLQRPDSSLAQGAPPDVVQSMQRQPGKDIAVLGGAQLARAVVQAGLVDEYRLLVLPTLFGGGTRLFEGQHARERLELLEVRRMDTGATLLRYARAR